MGKLDIQVVEPAKKWSCTLWFLSLSSPNHSLRPTSHLATQASENLETQIVTSKHNARNNTNPKTRTRFFILFPRERFILELSLSLQENQKIVVGFKKKKKMSVIDILFRVDEICKKYDKYDIEKQRDLNAYGDDAFAHLYSSLEAEIEAALHVRIFIILTIFFSFSLTESEFYSFI